MMLAVMESPSIRQSKTTANKCCEAFFSSNDAKPKIFSLVSGLSARVVLKVNFFRRSHGLF